MWHCVFAFVSLFPFPLRQNLHCKLIWFFVYLAHILNSGLISCFCWYKCVCIAIRTLLLVFIFLYIVFSVDAKYKHFENASCPIYVPVDIDVLVILLLPYFLVCWCKWMVFTYFLSKYLVPNFFSVCINMFLFTDTMLLLLFPYFFFRWFKWIFFPLSLRVLCAQFFSSVDLFKLHVFIFQTINQRFFFWKINVQ